MKDLGCYFKFSDGLDKKVTAETEPGHFVACEKGEFNKSVIIMTSGQSITLP